jgi:hypothetical protein
MTPDSSGDAPLDFSAPANSDIATPTCAACKQPIVDQYWSAGGAVLCGTCKNAVERGQQAAPDVMSRAGRFGRAALYGVGAMLVGALIWYAAAKFLNLEIGLIAILLGYMVGRAVFIGSARRGGRRYQTLAVFLTYLGIGLAYAPFALETLRDSARTKADSAGAAPGAASIADSSAAELSETETAAAAGGPNSLADTSDTHGGNPSPAGFLLGIGVLLLGILTLPVIVTVGGLPGSVISLAIYGFAVVQAWRLAASVTVAFAGPFRVGGSLPA